MFFFPGSIPSILEFFPTLIRKSLLSQRLIVSIKVLFYRKFYQSLMTITKDTVKKISKLSRIASNEKFEENMIKDLNAILKFVDQLNEVKIENIEPLASTVEQELIKRDDEVKKMNEKKDILINSPEENEDFYVVPKVIE